MPLSVLTTAPAAALAVCLIGCGGSQTPADPAPSPVVMEQPPARVVEPVEPAGPTLNHHVYWDGIHVMTIYEMPGVIRSEVRGEARPPYGERNPHFSLISHYFESEDRWVAAIQNATSVEDLLARLGRIALVELDTVEVEPQEL